MFDLRKLGFLFALIVLIPLFSNSFADAFFEKPNYNDFCKHDYFSPEKINNNCSNVPFPIRLLDNCSQTRPIYEDGCIVDYACDSCHEEYERARESFSLNKFLILTLLGVFFIVLGFLLPAKKELHSWTSGGLIIAGLINLFVGTALYFQYMHSILRPIVLFLEILLILFIAYRKINN